MSAGHESVCGTRGSGIVSRAADVLWMSVVRGVRGIGGVCEICMCLGRGREGVEWIRGLALGFTNPVGTGGVLDVAVVWVEWCYVCVSCESGYLV